MSLFLRLVGDTGSSEANNTASQEPRAECQEYGPSTPGTRPLHSTNTSEDVIIERNDLTRFKMVPEVFDHDTGELVNLPAERVDFGNLRPVLRSFDQYKRLSPSHEEVQQHLCEARIGLVDKLPLSHPLWDRMKMNGSLKAEESPSAAKDSVQKNPSNEDAALKEARRDVDWWDEEDHRAEDNFSEDNSDEDKSDEDETGEDAAVEDAAVEDAAVEDAAVEDAAVEDAAVEDAAVEDAAVEDAAAESTNAESWSPRDVSSESSAEE